MIDISQITQSPINNGDASILVSDFKELGSAIEYTYKLQKQIFKKLSESQKNPLAIECKSKPTLQIMQKMMVLKKQFGILQEQCQNQWPLMYKELLEIINSIATLYQIKIGKLQEKLSDFQSKNKEYEEQLRITKRLLRLNQNSKEKSVQLITNQSNQLFQMKKNCKVRISQYITENKESEKMKKLSQMVTVVNSPRKESKKMYKSTLFVEKDSIVSENSDLQTIKNLQNLQKKDFEALLNEMNYNSVSSVLVYPKESCQNTLRKTDVKNAEKQSNKLNQTTNIKSNFTSSQKEKKMNKKSISKPSTNLSGRKDSVLQQNWSNSKFEDLRRELLSRRRSERLF